jgi:hypothetical protein
MEANKWKGRHHREKSRVDADKLETNLRPSSRVGSQLTKVQSDGLAFGAKKSWSSNQQWFIQSGVEQRRNREVRWLGKKHWTVGRLWRDK